MVGLRNIRNSRVTLTGFIVTWAKHSACSHTLQLCNSLRLPSNPCEASEDLQKFERRLRARVARSSRTPSLLFTRGVGALRRAVCLASLHAFCHLLCHCVMRDFFYFCKAVW